MPAKSQALYPSYTLPVTAAFNFPLRYNSPYRAQGIAHVPVQVNLKHKKFQKIHIIHGQIQIHWIFLKFKILQAYNINLYILYTCPQKRVKLAADRILANLNNLDLH